MSAEIRHSGCQSCGESLDLDLERDLDVPYWRGTCSACAATTVYQDSGDALTLPENGPLRRWVIASSVLTIWPESG